MDKRQKKGFEIAKQWAVRETKDGWFVRSQSGHGFYKVSDDFVCECADSELHNETCKHAFAVRYYLDIEKQKPTGAEIEKIRLTYPQAWSAYNEAQTSEGRLFDELLLDLASSVKEIDLNLKGRKRHLLKDQVFVAIKRIYSQLSSRRSVSLFGASEASGKIYRTPHFNSMTQFLDNPKTTLILQNLIDITSAPLREIETEFAIDSTGFRTKCFGAYAESKYPSKRDHVWLKLHASCGVKTNIITSVRILDNEHSADSPQFIQIWRKMYFYFQMNQEEFLKNYHKRSNIESTVGAMKKKFGETLRNKNRTAQINELLCKVIAYNICVVIQEMSELGIKPDFVKVN